MNNGNERISDIKLTVNEIFLNLSDDLLYRSTNPNPVTLRVKVKVRIG